MNKKLYVLGGLLMITMLAFSSCSGDSATVPDAAETSEATDKNEATEAIGTEVVTAATELSEPTANKHPEVGTYVLITPETMSGYETETADDFYTYIKRKAAVKLPSEAETTTGDTANRYEIIVGDMQREETANALAKFDYNQYGIFISDYKIVITGWTEYTTRLAAERFNDLLTDILFQDDSGTYHFNLESAEDVVETYEDYIVDFPVIEGTIRGVYDCADGAYAIFYSDAQATDFESYEAAVKADGYTLYTGNTIGSNTYATYTKDEKLVHFYYVANAKELRVIYGHNDTNAALIQTAESNGSVTPGVTLMPMTYTSAAGGGACIIFTLEDGSFIVIDGGWKEEAAVLYDTLKALNEEVNGADAPIVISAWILTHAHVDHTGCIYRFSQNHGDEVAVNAILCNDVAEPQMSDSKVISYLNAENLKKVLQYFKTTTGDPTAVMKVHSGQKLTFGGAVLDVIFTHEDMVTQKVGNFNNLNTVIRLQLGGETFFLTADATSSELKKMLNEIPLEEFKADFCQVGHHGADSGYKGIYEAVEAKYYLWCNSKKHYIRDTEENKYDWDMYILENGKEIYLADTYCYTMELPYAEGSAIQWVPGSEKPSEK